MKEILSLICFSVSFLATHAHSVYRDTASIKFSTEGDTSSSTTPKLKVEVNLNDSYERAQTFSMPKDVERAKLNTEDNHYESKTPVLKIPTDPNVHYHMQHKKSDINYSTRMPNSYKHHVPLGNSTTSKTGQYSVGSMSKLEFLQDSLRHRQD